jgi:pumilio RNA-binding family
VIQKALEYVATKRLVALVGEFEGQQVLRCVHDQNGNHVIQKCIEVVSRVAKESQPELTEYLSSRIQFIIQAFSGRVRELSMHPYGCRVVQRILEHCTNTQKAPVLDELRKCCRELIQDQYGNYVIQHVMQHGWETDKAILIEEVQSRLLEYSQHKFASNVVEKCIQYADKKDRDQMIWTIINVTFDLNNPVDAKTGQCVLENMVRDPYANYVVQKVIDVSDAGQRGAIIRYMRENIVQLRRYTYGKHIIIRLEKVSGEKF